LSWPMADVSELLPASIRRRCDNCWRFFRRAGHPERHSHPACLRVAFIHS
jgi:hypothetical protein